MTRDERLEVVRFPIGCQDLGIVFAEVLVEMNAVVEMIRLTSLPNAVSATKIRQRVNNSSRSSWDMSSNFLETPGVYWAIS